MHLAIHAAYALHDRAGTLASVCIIPLCSQVEMYSDYYYIKGVVLESVPKVYAKITYHMRVEALVFDEKTDKKLY